MKNYQVASSAAIRKLFRFMMTVNTEPVVTSLQELRVHQDFTVVNTASASSTVLQNPENL